MVDLLKQLGQQCFTKFSNQTTHSLIANPNVCSTLSSLLNTRREQIALIIGQIR